MQEKLDDKLFSKYKETLVHLHEAYLDARANNQATSRVDEEVYTDNQNEYFNATIKSLDLIDPRDPEVEIQKWLYAHLLFGNMNDWKAKFNLNYRIGNPKRNSTLRALSESNGENHKWKVINFVGSLNTMVYTKDNVNQIENLIKTNNKIELIYVMGKLIMVDNDSKENNLIALADRYPDQVKIYSMNERPYIHCTFLLKENIENNRFMNWRAPHYEHEVFRSNIEMKLEGHTNSITLGDVPGFGLKTTDDIYKLFRINSDVYNNSQFSIIQENDFNFKNWQQYTLQEKIEKKEIKLWP